MKCVILAAGYATRLYPLTENFPKPLLEVRGRTILDWLLEDIDGAGTVDGYVVISNHKFSGHFEDWAEKHRLPVTVVDDGTETNETRLGAVRDIQFAVEQLGLDDDLLVIAGDNLLDFSLRPFIRYAEEKGTSCVMRYWEASEEKLRKTGVAVSVLYPDDEVTNDGYAGAVAGELLVGHLRIVLLRLYELMVEIQVVRRSCHKLTRVQKRLYQQAVQLRGGIEVIALACVRYIGRIAQGVIFSDFMLTFAMPLMILLNLICSTKVSKKSDMAKSWAARLCRFARRRTFCCSGTYNKVKLKCCGI